jgi:hypothetical protein
MIISSVRAYPHQLIKEAPKNVDDTNCHPEHSEGVSSYRLCASVIKIGAYLCFRKGGAN